MIFLLRKLKREIGFLGEHMMKILVSAFVCCFGGILLWVNGTNLWYVMNSFRTPKYSVSVTGAFFLWLIAYALCGAVLALILSMGMNICRCRSVHALTAFALGCGVYLLMLVWYAVFFCTHLTLFALILLISLLILTAALFCLVRRSLLILKVLLLGIVVVELYFLYFNISVL